jgi:hypothetical protein
MNTLLIILVVIIILALIYLFYRNRQYYKVLESFDNNRNSLSTYMQNDVDHDSFKDNNRKYSFMSTVKNIVHNEKVGWDGIWENESLNIYGQFIQNNDRLLISLSNSSFTLANYNTFKYTKINNTYSIIPNESSTPSVPNNVDIYYIDSNNCEITVTSTSNTGWSSPINIKINSIDLSTNVTATIPAHTTSTTYTMTFNTRTITFEPNYNNCPENSFVGIGKLNSDRTIFNLIEVLCSNYKDSNLNLNVGKFSGKISNNVITFYSEGISMNLQLNKVRDFLNLGESRYITNNYSYDNPIPLIPNSKLEIDNTICQTGSPCMDRNNGLSTTMYDGQNYNACGTTNSSSDNTCKTTSCVFYSPAPSGLSTCPSPTVNLYDYMNYMPVFGLTQKNGNTLNICEYLKMFSSDSCNSCILCYITNIGDVQTLNYQYFGTGINESTLTVQHDYMYSYLNGTNTSDVSTNTYSILPSYRNAINNGDQFKIENALSFTNILNNNTTGDLYKNQLNNSLPTAQKYVNQYVTRLTNDTSLVPAIWQINYNSSSNISSSCDFTLSTSVNYNTPVKYVDVAYDNNITLSLFGGGNSQKFIFDNVKVITQSNTTSNPYIVMTANICTKNSLYLIPSTENNGFSNNSNIVSLKENPEPNGKWFILGFSLNSLSGSNTIKSALNSINLLG